MTKDIPNTPEDVPFGNWSPFATSSTPSGASSRRLDRRTASKKENKNTRDGMVAKRTSLLKRKPSGGKDNE
jgi:hypothetical protein